MDWNVLRNWPKGLGCGLALALLLSLISFDLQDPTFTNLRTPSTGVANWLGLPGALIGGSLLELLGSAALLAPLLLLNYVLATRARPALHRYLAWCAGLLLALGGLHGLAVSLGDPALWGSGLVGWALAHWAGLTLGAWGGGLVLAYVAGVCALRIVYAPLARTAAVDAGVLTGLWLRGAALGLHQGALGVSRVGRSAVRTCFDGAAAVLHALATGLLRLPKVARRSAGAQRRALSAWMPRPADLWRAVVPMGRGRHGGVAAPAATFGEWQSQPTTQELRASGLAAEGVPVPVPEEDAGSFDWPETPAGTTALDSAWALAPAVEPESAPNADALGFTGSGEDVENGEDPDPANPAANLAEDEPDEAARRMAQARRAIEVRQTAEDSLEQLLERAAQGLALEFDRPEAQAAWRERFQRYARNLDLDWEEQLWRKEETRRRPAPEAADSDT